MKRLKTQSIKISKIEVGKRFRTEPGDIESLAQSIENEGLINPITIDSDHNLLAGFRRLSACIMLKWAKIPATIYSIESEYEHRIVELIENIQRKDMTWVEQAALVKRINSLMKASKPTWNQTQTADLLKMSPGHISDQLMIADVVDEVPELQEISSFKEAVKTYRMLCATMAEKELSERLQQKATAHRAKQGASASQTHPPQDSPQLGDHPDDPQLEFLALNALAYRIGDTIEGIKGLPKHELFDYVEVDPPYNAAYDYNYFNTKLEMYGDRSYYDFMLAVLQACHDKMQHDSYLLCWFPSREYQTVRLALDASFGNLNYDPIPAIWYKNTQPAGDLDRFLARRYEPFFVAFKGKPVIRLKGLPNVFTEPTVPSTDRWHPVQRPLDLVLRLSEIFAAPHARTLVPFAGSGTTINAHFLRNPLPDSCVGFDINSDYRSRYLANLSYPTAK